MAALYNENEPYAVEWLRNLAQAGHIAAGAVDPRDVRELRPDDVRGQRQVHFFAGIGGWSYALRLAGWPDEFPVWTGSCPCQPFSSSGRKKGFTDERHLWPAWFNLIRECRPSIIFGEQVASPDGLGWLDVVCADLEREDYAVGASDLCAAGVGAPHIRQRLFFVAVSGGERREGERVHLRGGESRPAIVEASGGGALSALADSGGHERGPGRGRETVERRSELGESAEQFAGRGDDSGGMGDAAGRPSDGRLLEDEQAGQDLERDQGRASRQRATTTGPWRDCEWLDCADGKRRAVEPGTFPLAHGVPARVGKLRAYGNAIVPQVAAKFIRAARYAMIERQP